MNKSSVPIVLYDETCAMCRSLAAFGQRKARDKLNFLPWHSHQHLLAFAASIPSTTGQKPDHLLVLHGQQLHKAEEAWRFLIEYCPELSRLAWLARQLGLTRSTSILLDRSGRFVRRFCRQCS